MSVYSPIGDIHTVRYWLTTLDPQTLGAQPISYPIAELPFTGVTFSLCFNQAGPFTATLNVENEHVAESNWIEATNPGKTFFWVIADNRVVYGGRVLNRTYNLSAQQVTITGAGFHGYWAQRLQAKDYTATIQTYSGSYVYAWANATHTLPGVGVPAPLVAWQLLRDAAAVTGSLPNLTVPAHGTAVGSNSDPDTWLPAYLIANYITFSAPLSQQQTIDSLLQQLVNMGGGATLATSVGCDIVTDVNLDGDGNPYATTSVWWPRYGQTAAELGDAMQVVDLSTVIDLEWNEDATAQATGIVEMNGAGGVKASAESVDTVALNTYHYPLVEQALCHTSTSPTTLSASVLSSLLKGDRDLYTYPQLAPVVTVPAFGQGTGFSLTNLPLGDDVGMFNPYERMGQSSTGLPSVPFPPKGSPSAYLIPLRLIRADVTIADEGVSTMQLTLNPAPGNPSPPGYQ